MKTSKFTDAPMVAAVRSAEAGTQVAEICRTLGVSEATFFRWKRRIGDLGTAEVRELRQLREETRKREQLVADLSLDKTILQESPKRKC
ncbi:MAG: Mobile element protein [uncultured Gemmatimonadaceae bacterium]|uniref:Mobile element protein n=1 Tax=uncultured Gemmatimonadaceae bacterium TaxID=246130 RepID=A0A6J4K573_9BACT|nr:MAG: Mobile element protein [uncultured Gemmatimonadaceae bacterium]